MTKPKKDNQIRKKRNNHHKNNGDRGNNTKEELVQSKKDKEINEKAALKSKLKAKRLEKTKILCKKTKRGQPVMKDRIKYLLKKIEESKK